MSAGGSDCNDIDSSEYQCGGVIQVVSSPVTIQSPNRGSGGDYPTGQKCVWLLKHSSKPLKLEFTGVFDIKSDAEVEVRANFIQQPAAK